MKKQSIRVLFLLLSVLISISTPLSAFAQMDVIIDEPNDTMLAEIDFIVSQVDEENSIAIKEENIETEFFETKIQEENEIQLESEPDSELRSEIEMQENNEILEGKIRSLLHLSNEISDDANSLQKKFTDTNLSKTDTSDPDPSRGAKETAAGSILISAVDEKSKSVRGVKIGLFQLSEKNLTASNAESVAITDEKGSATFQEIAYGTYVVQSIEVEEGYILNDTEYEVLLSKEKKEVKVTIKISQMVGVVEVLNKTTADRPIEGSGIGLFPSGTTKFIKENAVAEQQTSTDGAVEFTGVKAGNYVVAQISVPNGYSLNLKGQDISIREHGQKIKVNIVNSTAKDSTTEKDKSAEKDNTATGTTDSTDKSNPSGVKSDAGSAGTTDTKTSTSESIQNTPSPQTGDNIIFDWYRLFLAGAGILVMMGLIGFRIVKKKHSKTLESQTV